MPITGLVITLAGDGQTAGQARTALAANRSLVLGEAFGSRVAGVLDTPNESENRRHWEWLNSLAGVVFVDVVYIALDPVDGDPAMTAAYSD